MQDNPSPKASFSNTIQSSTDADERFTAELQALYLAPVAPERLRQSGAEQIRHRLETSGRLHAHRAPFAFLRGGRKEPAALPSALGSGLDAYQSGPLGGDSHHNPPSRLTAITSVATVALISILAAALFASPRTFVRGYTSPAASGHPVPTVTASGRVLLSSVAMISASDGWAFGWESKACIVLHYNGTTWARSNGSACANITSISMLSADEGWAVGGSSILHYSHGSWQMDTGYARPSENVDLTRVAMVSPEEGWVVGTDSAPTNAPSGAPSAFILHYTNGHWIPAPLAGMAGHNPSSLRGITMISAQEGWAVGSYYTASRQEATLMLHYINGQWTRVDWSTTGSFNCVVALSSGDMWAVGEVNAESGPGLIVHFKHGAVVQEDHPTPVLLYDIAMISPDDGWAVGDGATTLRYQGSKWKRQGLTIHQFYLTRISLVSATEGWATGNSAVSNSRDPNSTATLFHLSGGVWRIYPLTGL